ncbi:MAG: hypothetical protein ACFFC7_24830 [Candidatus Hermodarchaeota archaeon]
MVVYEVGVQIDGVPAVSKTFYSETFTKLDETLRNGLIAAIQGFAAEAFSDEIDTLQMKHFAIASVAKKSQNCVVTAFAIFDKKTKVPLVRKKLLILLQHFLDNYPLTSALPLDQEKYMDFLPVIDDVMKSLTLKPEDRMKSVFG